MKRKTAWWILSICLVMLVVLIVIIKAKSGDEIRVTTEKTARHTITETVSASGKIYPETEIKYNRQNHPSQK